MLFRVFVHKINVIVRYDFVRYVIDNIMLGWKKKRMLLKRQKTLGDGEVEREESGQFFPPYALVITKY